MRSARRSNPRVHELLGEDGFEAILQKVIQSSARSVSTTSASSRHHDGDAERLEAGLLVTER